MSRFYYSPHQLPGTPSKRARWLLMSCHLYYDRDSPVLSDMAFDRLSDLVADDLENYALIGGIDYTDLDGVLAYCLGTPDSIRQSGFHVKLTAASFYGAMAWHELVVGERLDPLHDFFGRAEVQNIEGQALHFIPIGA